MYLVVKSEDDGSVLLESKVHTDDIYQKQQGMNAHGNCLKMQTTFIHLIYIIATLIVWNEPLTQEPDTGIDLALSFQESEGCQDVW